MRWYEDLHDENLIVNRLWKQPLRRPGIRAMARMGLDGGSCGPLLAYTSMHIGL